MTPQESDMLSKLFHFYVADQQRGTVATINQTGAQVAALTAKVDQITVGGIDYDLLAGKVADLLAARLKD